ncbi:carbohydrate sulfotransferase 4 [Lepeophtheirus salmonis]|uniref:carbohydrate sulfotransferase 4 n=1 Tax=Lepeophtheirus salmonis TaxID=72036 RepID=UPI001AE0EF8D|nr:carbohydrate sulfotransferase 4-like isoform X1 [Lepeophtheirus salmonis]
MFTYVLVQSSVSSVLLSPYYYASIYLWETKMSRIGRKIGISLILMCGVYVIILNNLLPLNPFLPTSPSPLNASLPTFGYLQQGKTALKFLLESSEIKAARHRVSDELKDFPLDQIHLLNQKGQRYSPSWADLLLEEGGQPLRALIFTTWRSGSTFMGDILTSHPSAFYHYEPLLYIGIRQVRESDPGLADQAINVIKSLLHCKYDDLGDYLSYGKKHHWLFNHNERLWNHCLNGKNKACWNPQTLDKICAIHPFQTLKTVRLRLSLARSFLDDKSLQNIKILHIVRDPRGTLQSRKHRDWCPGEPDCYEPKNLCSDLTSDYHSAKELIRDYPNRFMVFRYEDFSNDPFNNSKKVLDFFSFVYHDKVRDFLKSHTAIKKGGVSSTFRNSKTAPYHWMKDLKIEEILSIQKECGEALRLWGYVPYKYSSTDNSYIKSFNPLTNYSLV